MSTSSEPTAPLVAPPGLKGLVVADTTVGSVRGEEGYFHYRDIDATVVAATQPFEAAAALLLDGKLPVGDGATGFRAEVGAARHLDPATTDLVVALADRVDDPLAALRAVWPALVDDTPVVDLDHAARRARVLRAAAVAVTVLAAHHRRRTGQVPLAADPGLGHATDYLRMLIGATPSIVASEALERYLLVTADHGFNASTFTARVVTSTGAGVASVMSAALSALSGPLHGGAPSRVLDMLDEIGDPAHAEAWVQARLNRGEPIMGFGHAVYRAEDPRGVLLRREAERFDDELVERAIEIEQRILALLARWKPTARIVTNVEYYAAVALHLAGVPRTMFTPTFAASRAFGWAAHVLEQAADNKIMRPAARYVGPPPTSELPLVATG
ncbi:MAG: citrate/2-methylcitrate synthase [Actinomycetota bacterium]